MSKKAEIDAKNAKLYAESIVNTIRESLLVLDDDLRIVSANESFYNTFQVNPEETLEKYVYELGGGQWDIPQLKTLLEEIIPQNEQFEDFEVRHEFPHIGQKIMRLNAHRIEQKGDRPQLILLAIEDVTK